MVKLNAIGKVFQRTTQQADKSFVRIFENGNKAVMSADESVLKVFDKDGKLLGRKKIWTDSSYAFSNFGKKIEKDFTPTGNPRFYAYRCGKEEGKALYNENGMPTDTDHAFNFIPKKNLIEAFEFKPNFQYGNSIEYSQNIFDDVLLCHKEMKEMNSITMHKGNQASSVQLWRSSRDGKCCLDKEIVSFKYDDYDGYSDIQRQNFGRKEMALSDKDRDVFLDPSITRRTTKNDVKAHFSNLLKVFNGEKNLQCKPGSPKKDNSSAWQIFMKPFLS